MELPDQMPEECNFYGLIRTTLTPEAVAERFVSAGWKVTPSEGEQRLEIRWGKLTLVPGNLVVLQGWLDRPDDRVGTLLGLLSDREIAGERQWINSQGRLWRELPFDESILDPDDPRLPADIKASIRASRERSGSAPVPRKPWCRFW